MKNVISSICVVLILSISTSHANTNDCDFIAVFKGYDLSKRQVKEITKIIKKNFVDTQGEKVRGKVKKDLICELASSGAIQVKEVNSNKPKSASENETIFVRIDSNYGYMKLSEFGEHTEEELKAIISSEIWGSASNIVIDLRGNKGGALHNVLKVSRLLGEKGQIIGHIKGSFDFTYKVDKSDGFSLKGKKVVALIDNATSRGAELFVSFLKMNDLASTAGEKTNGNTRVDIASRISDNLYMVVPSGYLFGPLNKKIHGAGVKPDIDIIFESCIDEYKICIEKLGVLFE